MTDNTKDIFIKKNTSAFKDSLLREAEGLACLRACLDKTSNTLLNIPEVFRVDEEELHTEKIQSTHAGAELWKSLGMGLAELHQIEQERFGFATNNYIGLNPQMNFLTENWGEFFVEYRLKYQLGLIENKLVRERFHNSLQQVEKTLIDFLNEYCGVPSLVHGDLWSGNVMFGTGNNKGGMSAWLIDPAVYFGDREADIAMTEMFGGFNMAFYQAYSEVLALSDVYADKKVIYNLYHYLNHYNLFGGSYLGACQQSFQHISRVFR